MTNEQLEAAKLTIAIAEQRWPNANRVTHPELVRQLDQLKTKVWREEQKRLAAHPTPASVDAKPEQDMRWISVAERMPDTEDEVLVYFPTAKYNKVDLDCWRMQHESPVAWTSQTVEIGMMWDNHEFEDITHWMPLPAHPTPASGEQE